MFGSVIATWEGCASWQRSRDPIFSLASLCWLRRTTHCEKVTLPGLAISSKPGKTGRWPRPSSTGPDNSKGCSTGGMVGRRIWGSNKRGLSPIGFPRRSPPLLPPGPLLRAPAIVEVFAQSSEEQPVGRCLLLQRECGSRGIFAGLFPPLFGRGAGNHGSGELRELAHSPTQQGNGNRAAPGSTFPCVQNATQSDALTNVSWLPGKEHPVGGLAEHKCNMVSVFALLQEGAFSPGTLRPLRGVATRAPPRGPRKRGGRQFPYLSLIFLFCNQF